MSAQPDERKLLADYFLARLSGEEAEAVELRCLADEEFYERFGVQEEALIRDFLLGSLLPADRAAFERRYLNVPALRGRVESTAALFEAVRLSQVGRQSAAKSVQHPEQFQGSPWKWLVGVRGLALAFGVLLVFIVVIALRQGSTARRTPQSDPLGPSTLVAVAEPPVSQPFALLPGGTRKATDNLPILKGPLTSEFAEFLLDVEPGQTAPHYHVAVRSPDRGELWTGTVKSDNVGPHSNNLGDRVRVKVPAAILSYGDYLMVLDGEGGGGHQTYVFGFR